MIAIPQGIADQIDRLAGKNLRTHFIVELLQREIRRREQIAALQEAAGCWTDKNHPELAKGSKSSIREMRKPRRRAKRNGGNSKRASSRSATS